MVCASALHSSHMSYSTCWRVKYLSHFPCPQKECFIEYLFKAPLPINSLHSHNNLVKSYYQTYLKLRKLRVKGNSHQRWFCSGKPRGARMYSRWWCCHGSKRGRNSLKVSCKMEVEVGPAPCWHGPLSPLCLLCRRICYSVEKIQV